MTTSRQDAWSSEEDVLLADLVLSHIREASTQLRAFEEAGKRLRRTPAACGFRWNSNIRKQYKEEINQAKRDKKKIKVFDTTDIEPNTHPIQREQQPNGSILANASSFLNEIEKELAGIGEIKIENRELTIEVNRLEEQNELANEKVKNLAEKYNQLKKDYHSLMYLLDKARKIADEFTEDISHS